MSAVIQEELTIGGLTKRFPPLSRKQVTLVVDRLGVARRVGKFRIIPGDQLDRIETGLRAAGYLKREAEPISA